MEDYAGAEVLDDVVVLKHDLATFLGEVRPREISCITI